MTFRDAVLRHPRLIGIACAVGATGLGGVYMAMADAPMRYLIVNGAALIMGVMILLIAGRLPVKSRRWPGVMVLLMGAILLATSLLGIEVDGAKRWVLLGSLSIQSSFVLLPLMLVAFARSRDLLATIGLMIAALALALQPDRAMAGVLAAALAILATMKPERLVLSAFAVSLIGFCTTMLRPDSLPAQPFVEYVLVSSFKVHTLAGFAVAAGCLTLLVPAITGWFHDSDHRESYAVFGVVWLAALVASALGNYPTPLVGYGGSAVLGYVLSLAMFPKPVRQPVGAGVTDTSGPDQRGVDGRQHFASA